MRSDNNGLSLHRVPNMKPMLHMLFASFAFLFVVPHSQAQEAKRIADTLQTFVDRQTLAGAVAMVANRDKVMAVEAVGFADIAGKKPMKTDSMFWIASQTKPITAAALMILYDEGKFKLDDPIENYLPEFADVWVAVEKDKEHIVLKRPKQKITIRHALSHMSGMPFASQMERPTLDMLTLRDAVNSYAITPLMSEPGTKYAYSNEGINTAGRLIEVISKMDYETFLSKRLLEPLGMKDTTFRPNAEQIGRLAKAYRPNATNDGLIETKISQLTYPLDNPKRQPMPAGGLFSTASDVVCFCQMMLDNGTFRGQKILSPEAVKELTIKQTPNSIKEEYGLGFSMGKNNFGHGGALSTNMNIDTHHGAITIWLVQHMGYPGNGNQAYNEFRKMAASTFGKGK
jgi:CubicO group peptidase (beta-lactamase class C family)